MRFTSTRTTSTRRATLLAALACVAVAGMSACAPAPQHVHPSAAAGSAMPAAVDPAVTRDVARVRAATSPFRVLDSAVVAGYARAVPNCIDNPGQGAMGFHHANRALYDDRVELEHPEILVYSRTDEGAYRLNGVEYIIPYSKRSRDQEPPIVMGQQLKRSDELKLWYLHVWVWEPNPSGLFADWNPRVKC